jgi:hypothetical protein
VGSGAINSRRNSNIGCTLETLKCIGYYGSVYHHLRALVTAKVKTQAPATMPNPISHWGTVGGATPVTSIDFVASALL